jgi:pimeloyl-ACP methyl ester carboxylesterase
MVLISVFRRGCVGGAALFGAAMLLAASAHAFETAGHYVASSADPASRIYVAEKLAPGTTAVQADKAVLFVHGATYPSLSFDLPIAGYNWMDYVGERGWAAYALDIRGYGNSTRPREMAAPAGENRPVMRAEAAIVDILDAVDFIRRRTGLAKVSLVGWSWGTVTAGLFTTRHQNTVDKLVLYAPVYGLYLPERLKKFRLADPEDETRFNPAIGAYRAIDAASIRSRWEAQIVPEEKSAWREEIVATTWIDALIASDPDSGRADPPAMRAPNGVLVDVFEIFSGRPIFDAADILRPTLVIRGADDPTATDADARGLTDRLGAELKAYVIIEDGSHFISLEKNAPALMERVQRFLDDPAS